MSSTIMRSIAATRPAIALAFRPASVLAFRTFADRATPGQSGNATDSRASSAEGQGIMSSRSTDGRKQQDTGSVSTPVSNPEESGIGGQEEQTQSQGAMKRDPNESDEQKRKKVLEFGQNKKLDAADDGQNNKGKPTANGA